MTATDQERFAGQSALVVVGASGMVGGYILRYALEMLPSQCNDHRRKTLGISHPKLTDVCIETSRLLFHSPETLSGQDAAVFCLGAYTGAVSDADSTR